MEFFRKTLDPIIALAAIAVLDIFMFLLMGAWTVGGGETMMTGLMAQAVLGDELQRDLARTRDRLITGSAEGDG